MTDTDIIDCLQNIKIKNCEGFDRIPQRILVDGAQVLITPLKGLFHRAATPMLSPHTAREVVALQAPSGTTGNLG